MRQTFREMDLKPETRRLITQANAIIDNYQRQGYRLTLRQLYYQFVTQNLITNEEKSYKRLAGVISDGRLCGLIDWDAIEDRGRVAEVPLQFESIQHRVTSALANYRLPRWRGQNAYVELWVEKQALAGVLEPLAHRFHVTLMVNKGYSSQSAMYEAAQRFAENMGAQEGTVEVYDKHGEPTDDHRFAWLEPERDGVLLYLGDHDPSGEDMVRDISERMEMFGLSDEILTVKKIGLTTAQVRQYNPPPNPAKMTDPRAASYIALHGRRSWEVDALPPRVLNQLVTAAIGEHLDQDLMNEVIEQENSDKAKLTKAAEKIR